jgi:hypothetical protein
MSNLIPLHAFGAHLTTDRLDLMLHRLRQQVLQLEHEMQEHEMVISDEIRSRLELSLRQLTDALVQLEGYAELRRNVVQAAIA